jgi:hypothetical protein
MHTMTTNPLETVEIARTFVPVPHPDYPEQGFHVRGLGLPDVLRILTDHGRTFLPAIVARLDPQNEAHPLLPGAERELGEMLLARFPDILAAVIALAADDPENETLAGLLPLSAQIIALDAIIGLTKTTLNIADLLASLQTIGAHLILVGGEGAH